jgi:hypothetical protein
MNAWNSLLEALHSALVDEINGRLPDEKPVLGLPRRMQNFALPSEKVAGFLASEVVLEGSGRGVAFVAIEPGLSNGGGLGAEAEERLWSAVSKRAVGEFARRSLDPVFGPPRMGKISLPPGLPAPRVLIWIPFGMMRGQVFLGLGVA